MKITTSLLNRRQWLTLLLLFITTQTMHAQQPTVSLTVTGCPAGVYGEFTTPLPPGAPYTVERHEPNGPPRVVEQFLPCGNSAMLLKRMRAFARLLPGYALPTKAMADTLWARFGGKGKHFPTEVALPLARLAFGLSFLDTGGITGRTYQYRVRLTDSLSTAESVEIAYRPQPVHFAPMTLQHRLTDQHSIALEWRTNVAGAPPLFDVYRRQAGAAAGFQPVSAVRGERSNARGDSLVLLVFDSTGIAGITYDYFLLARDRLGNTGNHSDTARIQAGGRDNVPTIRNLRTRSIDGEGIRLTWNAVARDVSLRNILVLRSAAHDTGYATIALAAVSDTTYVDKTAAGGHRYFYQLLLQGAENYSRATPRVSGTYTGAVQVRAPEGLIATGLKHAVRLTWHTGERNLAGFRVFRAAYAGGPMTFIGDRLLTAGDSTAFSFTDTTQRSDKASFYYAVAAISSTSGTGPLSDVVAAAPSATTRVPVPAGIRPLWLNDSVVSVTWRDLARETPGISGYRVFVVKNETDTGGIFLTTCHVNEFVDTLHDRGERWYRFATVNVAGVAGNKSPVVHVQATIDKPLAPGRLRAFRDGRQVVLDWDAAANTGVRYYNIYRAENAGRITLIDSVHADKHLSRYTDAAIKSGNTYFYFVTSVGTRAIESSRSPEVHLMID